MFEISFRDELDAKTVFFRILEANPEGDSILSLHKEKIVVESKDIKFYQNIIIPAIKSFIIKVKERAYLLSTLENTFHFKDEEEHVQILSILQSILQGERSDIPNLPPIQEREQLLDSIIHGFLLKPVSFSFESFLTFRLKEYYDALQVYLEAAIDEYKLEQEYQSFIHQLRELLIATDSKLNEVHLVYHHQFEFYDEDLNHITKNQLIKYMNRTHFNNYSYYIDSVVLAPLVSIAPRKLFLYTDNIDHQLVETIRNIFEERTEILPYHYFGQKKSKID